VESLLAQTAKLTNFLADRDQILDQVLTNLTPVLRNLNGQGDAINSTVTELKAMMTGLAQQRTTIGTTIEQMSKLITQTSDFLVDARQPAIQLLRSMRQTTQMFVDNIEAVRAAVLGFPKLLGAFGRATSYVNGLNVYVCRLDVTALGVTVPIPPNDGPYSKVCGG
jgi:phospholipid/cholesterol/gamma-HCH transport system substrate-binding protein